MVSAIPVQCSAVLYQLSYQVNWELIALVVQCEFHSPQQVLEQTWKLFAESFPVC